MPWATLFSKGITVGFGRTHDRRYTVLLRDLVISGRARPGVVVTHHGGLEDAPKLHAAFDRRAEGVIKAVLRPRTRAGEVSGDGTTAGGAAVSQVVHMPLTRLPR